MRCADKHHRLAPAHILHGFLLLLGGSPVFAEVSTDGSLGTAQTLPGPDFQIGAELGKQQGGNLFHSFSHFDLLQGESATFTGSDNIDNIIARVTGGISRIDGVIRTAIPQANLFLLNPSGVIFGPNAGLDSSGSFHVSSGDYLKLADDQIFSAHLQASPLLSSAPPQAFGFLDAGAYSIETFASQLAVDEGRQLSLIGGPITLHDNTVLSAPSGAIVLAAINSAGEMPLDGSPSTNAPLDYANIQLSHSQLNSDGQSLANGSITLQGHNIRIVNGSLLYAFNHSTQPGADIRLSGQQVYLEQTFITTSTDGSGASGNIDIAADNVDIRLDSQLVAVTQGAGQGGTIHINTLSAPDGGKVALDSRGRIYTSAASSSTGPAGSTRIETGELLLNGGSTIASYSRGAGNGGDIVLDASQSMSIQGESVDATNQAFSSGLISSTDKDSSGNGGHIVLQTPRLLLTDNALLASSTSGSGDAGGLLVSADSATIANGAGMAADSYATGSGGSINLLADTVTLNNTGFISTASNASGDGGNIFVAANTIALDDAAAISADSTSPAANAGEAGEIMLSALDSLTITGNSTVSAQAENANGGNIAILAGQQLLLHDGSIATSVKFGDIGNGGNIDINSPFAHQQISQQFFNPQSPLNQFAVDQSLHPLFGKLAGNLEFLLLNASRIQANAWGGNGGNITIRAAQFLPSFDSVVEASSRFGLQGVVSINAMNANIASGLAVLPGYFINNVTLGDDHCSVAAALGQSSFVVSSRGALPDSPDNLLDSSGTLSPECLK